MNNLFQQKQQFLRFTEQKPNSDIYSVDVWDQEKIFLTLTVDEFYSQYLKLGLESGEQIEKVEVISVDGDELSPNFEFYSSLAVVGEDCVLIFGFRSITATLDCKSFYLKITSKRNGGTKTRIMYSNIFNISTYKEQIKRTSLVTYWHSENFYNADYVDFNFIPQQMRLPLSFAHMYSEADAEEYQNTYEIENEYRSGKVKRLFMEAWDVQLNDANYSAFCAAMDCDFIYFNNYFFSVKPFSPERDKEKKGWTISEIECQRDPSKKFDQDIFFDYFDIYADEITYDFTYDNGPVNTPNAGQWFLVNRLYNNYVNDFGILYNCELKFELLDVPVLGFLANNLHRSVVNVGDIISYCDKDNLTFFPNGFDNDLGISGDFTETFTYRIIDQNGNKGQDITHTINMTDINVPVIETSVLISWADNTTAPKTSQSLTETAKIVSIVDNPADLITTSEWEYDDGNGFVSVGPLDDPKTFTFIVGVNKIRAKVTTASSAVFYSNVLTFTGVEQTYPLTRFEFQAQHPEGYPGVDKVVYLNSSGNETELILQRAYFDEYGNFFPAPCTVIWAYQIVATYGAGPCINQ